MDNMDIAMNIWRIIYDDIYDKNPDATGNEILTMAKKQLDKITNEVINKINNNKH